MDAALASKKQRVSWISSYSFKLGLTFTLLLVGATSISLFVMYNQTKPLLLGQMGSRLEDIGRTATYLFGEKEFSAIEKVKLAINNAQKAQGVIISPAMPGEYRKTLSDEVAKSITQLPEFQSLVSILRWIKNSSASGVHPISAKLKAGSAAGEDEPTLAFVSLYFPASTDNEKQVAQFIADSDYDHPVVPAPPGNLLFNNSPALREAFKGGVGADPDFRFEQGMHILTAAVPLRDKSGERRAILSLYYDAHGEVNFVNRLYYTCIMIVALSLIVAIFCALLLTWFLTRDIRRLSEAAEKVRNRDFSVAIDLHRHDELGVLAHSFNAMVAEVRLYSDGLQATNKSYARFVPTQILEFLGQASITDVRLGDQVQRQMTVLFADIRSFTTISESMSPRDNFDFINQYLRTIGPIIRKHNGFIDKYIGDAIMALFPDRPEDAVHAAVEMHKVLEQFNREGKEHNRPAVEIGVGIHRGNLMLGTVGEEERMDGTVISDAVNLASRLEGLTKQYGASIIISESVLEAIPGQRSFEHRYLGETQVKGKRRSVRIFEVLDGDRLDSARRKAIGSKQFEKAVKYFEKADFGKAARLFSIVLRAHKKDLAAQMYYQKCKQLLPGKKSKPKLIEVEDERFQKKG